MDDFPEDLAIRVRGVGKTYRLGVINRRTFRDELVYRWLRLRGRDPKDSMGRLGGRELADPSLFHALDDVSFDIRKGETVGFIGRNGAGKSTMLKILARITTPTTGEAWIRGRVGSLLEVGTGFHPELTGRENIYLNGTILGMSKKEIDAKFEEIVDFSEIGEFLDTPVKRYSSGMYVRLAFSVASSLDCDILLLDEVLAVGDATFRKKSLARMKEIAASGRTILFVSHAMSNIRDICSRCLLFDQGQVAMDGPVADVTNAYECDDENHPSSAKEPVAATAGPPAPPPALQPPPEPTQVSRAGSGFVRATDVSFSFNDERDAWDAFVDYETADGSAWTKCRVALAIKSKALLSRPIAVFDSSTTGGIYGSRSPRGRITLELPASFRFPHADYSVDVRLWTGTIIADDLPDGFAFSPPDENSTPGWLSTPFRGGLVNVAHAWRAPRNPTSPDGQPEPGGEREPPRGGTGAVRAKDVSISFDGKRDGWNVFIDYETADGAPWTRGRAAVAVRVNSNPNVPLCVLDSNTTGGIYKDKPPKGRIVLELPPGIRFPENEYRIDIRLWVGTSVADDVPGAAAFAPSGNLSVPGWRRAPCLKGRFNLRHAWRVEVDGKPFRDPER